MKTISLKKVAVVAVASLGFGLLSVVPAQAATTTTMVEGITLANTTSTPVVGTAVVVNMGAAIGDVTGGANADALRFTGFLAEFPSGGFATVAANATAVGTDGELTGVTAAVGAQSDTAEAASGSNFTVTLTTAASLTDNAPTTEGDITASSTQGAAKFSFTPSKAGTHVLRVWFDQDADGVIDVTEAVQSLSITVAAAAGLSAGTSSAFIIAGNGTTAPSSASDVLPIAASRTLAGTNVAAIEVLAKDTSNNAYTSVALSATLTGPGYLDFRSGDADPTAGRCSATPTYSATIGRAITAQAADAEGQLYVCAGGDAGTATVTVTLTDTVSGVSAQIGSAKTITFYGSVAKLELVKSVWTNIRSGGNWQDGTDADTAAELRALTSSKTQSVTIKMTDSAGRVANSASEPTVVSGDTAVIAQGVCGLDDNADTTYSTGGTGFYNCGFQSATSAKSGDKATVTIRIVDPADDTKYLTVTANLTIGGAVASEVITTDKTTYAPGENMILTITAKDSAGNPAFDGAATPSAVVASKSAIGLPSAASFYQGGKKSWGSTGGVYAPALGGTFTLTATGTDAAAKTLTATASVTDGNAGLLTQIDALNAKIVALNALIAKIMKKLGVK